MSVKGTPIRKFVPGDRSDTWVFVKRDHHPRTGGWVVEWWTPKGLRFMWHPFNDFVARTHHANFEAQEPMRISH